MPAATGALELDGGDLRRGGQGHGHADALLGVHRRGVVEARVPLGARVPVHQVAGQLGVLVVVPEGVERLRAGDRNGRGGLRGLGRLLRAGVGGGRDRGHRARRRDVLVGEGDLGELDQVLHREEQPDEERDNGHHDNDGGGPAQRRRLVLIVILVVVRRRRGGQRRREGRRHGVARRGGEGHRRRVLQALGAGGLPGDGRGLLGGLGDGPRARQAAQARQDAARPPGRLGLGAGLRGDRRVLDEDRGVPGLQGPGDLGGGDRHVRAPGPGHEGVQVGVVGAHRVVDRGGGRGGAVDHGCRGDARALARPAPGQPVVEQLDQGLGVRAVEGQRVGVAVLQAQHRRLDPDAGELDPPVRTQAHGVRRQVQVVQAAPRAGVQDLGDLPDDRADQRRVGVGPGEGAEGDALGRLGDDEGVGARLHVVDALHY